MGAELAERVESLASVLLGGLPADEAARLAEVLRSARYRVEIANGPILAANGKPDVALLQPALESEDAAASPWCAEAARLGIPVIALIPANRPDQIERAVAAGATEVLLTPANPAEALARVRKVLRLVSLRAQAERLRVQEAQRTGAGGGQ